MHGTLSAQSPEIQRIKKIINLLIAKGIFPDVYKALEFIEKCQNDDGGVSGLCIGSESSLSPTAQTIRAWSAVRNLSTDPGRLEKRSRKAVDYVRGNILSSKNMQRIPKGVVALLEAGVKRDDPIVQEATKLLLEQRNDDGGWGFSKGHETTPYYTYFAVEALQSIDKVKYSVYIKEAAERIHKDLQSGKWNKSIVSRSLGALLLINSGEKKYEKVSMKIISGVMEELCAPWAEDLHVTDRDPYFTLKMFTPKVVLMLIAAQVSPLHRTIRRILRWLKDNQRSDGGWSWGTKESTSWPTALSVYVLFQLALEIDKSLLESYCEAYETLESEEYVSKNLEKIIEDNKRLKALQKETRLLHRLFGITTVGLTAFTAIIYFSFVRSVLSEALESLVSSHYIVAMVSLILVPLSFLYPAVAGYSLLREEADRKTLFNRMKWVSYFIISDIVLTILIKIAELSA